MSLEGDLLECAHPPTTSATTSEVPKTLSTVIALLTSLRPLIVAVLVSEPLNVPCETLEMRLPSHSVAKDVQVMLIVPDEREDNKKLRAVCGAWRPLLISDRYSDF